MTICLRKSCLFGLMCVSFVNVNQLYVCFFPFGFEALDVGFDCFSSWSLPIV